MFHDSKTSQIKKTRIRQFIAGNLGVAIEKIPDNIQELDVTALGGDSLDIAELVMELEEEFDIYVE